MSREIRLDPTKEALAVAALRSSLIDAGAGDDEQLILDTIEGETSLFELIDAVLEQVAADEALVEAMGRAEENLAARKARVKARVAAQRAIIEQALTIAELPKLERPLATLSLSKRAPVLVITEESDIPATYWRPAAPALDKKALTQALRDRAAALAALDGLEADAKAEAMATLPPEVPGALLSNAAPTVTLRFK